MIDVENLGEEGNMKIGVAGQGAFGVKHLEAIAKIPGIEVITLTGRFLQYYRENANWLERTYAFVPRVGIERIRAIVVDDADGIAADLDARMQKSVSSYRDPWAESRKHLESNQFRPSLPLIPLPEVPVR